MKKILGLFVLSLFAINASAADLLASSAAPTVTQNIVAEGDTCPGVGATGFSSTGLLLSCQSGMWKGGRDKPLYGPFIRKIDVPLNGFTYGVISYCPSGSIAITGGCNIQGANKEKWYDHSGPTEALDGWYCEAGAYSHGDTLESTVYCSDEFYLQGVDAGY